MLSRFFRDDSNTTWKHKFFGLLFVLLSLGTLSGIAGVRLDQPKILGIQTSGTQTIGSDQGTTGTTAGSGQNVEPTQTKTIQIAPTNQVIPTAYIEPTSAPVTIPNPSPTLDPALEEPLQTIIDASQQTAEIIIRNDSQSLIITASDNSQQYAKITPEQPIAQIIEQAQPTAAPTSAIFARQTTPIPTETQLVYAPGTQTPQNNSNTTLPSPTTAPHNQISNFLSPILPKTLVNIFSPDQKEPALNSQTEQYIAETHPNQNTDSGLMSAVQKSVMQTLFSQASSSNELDPQQTFETIQKKYFGDSEINDWLARYQFKVWPVGDNELAIGRNGIVTVTKYPIKLGLSKMSYVLKTESGDKQVLYYQDSVWSYLASLKIVTEEAFSNPIRLVESNGDLQYQLMADSHQLLFAAIPMNVCRDIVVSATTQEVMSVKSCSAVDSVVDAMSLTL